MWLAQFPEQSLLLQQLALELAMLPFNRFQLSRRTCRLAGLLIPGNESKADALHISQDFFSDFAAIDVGSFDKTCFLGVAIGHGLVQPCPPVSRVMR
jgi:hypothetical protein